MSFGVMLALNACGMLLCVLFVWLAKSKQKKSDAAKKAALHVSLTETEAAATPAAGATAAASSKRKRIVFNIFVHLVLLCILALALAVYGLTVGAHYYQRWPLRLIIDIPIFIAHIMVGTIAGFIFSIFVIKKTYLTCGIFVLSVSFTIFWFLLSDIRVVHVLVLPWLEQNINLPWINMALFFHIMLFIVSNAVSCLLVKAASRFQR